MCYYRVITSVLFSAVPVYIILSLETNLMSPVNFECGV